MTISSIKAIFDSNIERVWSVVTSLDDYLWCNDLSKIEVINDKQFIDYTKDGFVTTFTITLVEPLKRW